MHGKSVLHKYNQFVKSNQLVYDQHQFEVVQKLDEFYHQVVAADFNSGKTNKLNTLVKSLFRKMSSKRNESANGIRKPDENMIKSIYLYGGVGKISNQQQKPIYSF